MDKKIYLVRHGKIDYGGKRTFVGITDLPLCNEGISQAEKLKEFFLNINLEKAYTSTLTRCLQTIEIILGDRDIERIPVKEFREINLGEWEMKSFEYVKKTYPEQFNYRGNHIDTFATPGGESFSELQQRVIPAFERVIQNENGNILIVAHAGVNKAILCKLLGISLKDILDIKQDYGCINELSFDKASNRWERKQYLEV